MNCCGIDESDINCTARHLKTTFSSDYKQISDLMMEVKNLKRISKTFPVCKASESTIGEVRRRLLEIDKILPNLCRVTDELSLLQRLCHHGDELSPDPEKLYPDSYGAVLDSMAQYEANCKQKEGLENRINQAHIYLMKAQAHYNTTPKQPVLCHSKSVDSKQRENTPPKHYTPQRQQSVDSALPYSISLFQELSKETLETAHEEFQRRRPLQAFPQNGALWKESSSVGPIRIQRSPTKKQEGAMYSPPRKGPMYSPPRKGPMYSPSRKGPVYCPPGEDGKSPTVRASLNGSLSRVRSPVLNSFLKKEKEGTTLDGASN